MLLVIAKEPAVDYELRINLCNRAIKSLIESSQSGYGKGELVVGRIRARGAGSGQGMVGSDHRRLNLAVSLQIRPCWSGGVTNNGGRDTGAEVQELVGLTGFMCQCRFTTVGPMVPRAALVRVETRLIWTKGWLNPGMVRHNTQILRFK